VTCLDGSEATYAAEPSDQATLHEVNVKSFGAVGDPVTDDTAAFQPALDAVHKAQGGVVYPLRLLFANLRAAKRIWVL
jgi:polygalacturonase